MGSKCALELLRGSQFLILFEIFKDFFLGKVIFDVF